ncbi:MAG TPA: purine-binding chemotaxis protein CheW [Candidatus Marinimicrobia bacterium]|nr:purine-binding chemotaxis protein CheW [Candidatus Neomarinimicrobiota bacterium]
MSHQAQEKNGKLNRRYLTFVLGKELYGVDIHRVKTIISILPVTPVPGAPEYFVGVINLRGIILPVIDLRRRFAMPLLEYGQDATIIVQEIDFSGKIEQMGFLVDQVSEVIDINQEDIESGTDVGGTGLNSFFDGIAHPGGKVITLLNVQAVFLPDSEASIVLQV